MSANLEDLALGIAAALMQTREPEPLRIQFKSEAPGAIARLVDLVLDECADAGFEITAVFVPANIVTGLGSTLHPEGVRIKAKPELRDEVLFFRRSVPASC